MGGLKPKAAGPNRSELDRLTFSPLASSSSSIHVYPTNPSSTSPHLSLIGLQSCSWVLSPPPGKLEELSKFPPQLIASKVSAVGQVLSEKSKALVQCNKYLNISLLFSLTQSNVFEQYFAICSQPD